MGSRKSKLNRAIEGVKERELLVLKSLYDFRCLNEYQVYNAYYDNIKKSTYRKKILKLIKLDVIEEIKHFKDKVFFLKPTGINLLKHHYDLNDNIYDNKNKIHKRNYYTASELKISKNFIKHQLNLNNFVLNTLKFLKNKNIKGFTYQDEKRILEYKTIRPDGILKQDIEYFLEMDMNTETPNQLISKFKKYRKYYNSKSYFYKDKKIKVLFIIKAQTEKSLLYRKNKIKKLIYKELVDIINDEFDFFVGSPKECLQLIVSNLNGYNCNKNTLIAASDSSLKYSYLEDFEFSIKTAKKVKCNIRLRSRNFILYLDQFDMKKMTCLNKLYLNPRLNNSEFYVINGLNLETIAKEIKEYNLSLEHCYLSTNESILNNYIYKFDGKLNLYKYNLKTKTKSFYKKIE